MRKETAKRARSLDEYRNKRDPSRSNEPFSAERKGSDATLHGAFVVHLHDATRRHYDLRIEIGGALMSFAVPRGPSLDPKDKRLAVNTENHPLDYLDFEDVIPDGNYGAGAMIAWDLGRITYLEGSAEDGDRARQDRFFAERVQAARTLRPHPHRRAQAEGPTRTPTTGCSSKSRTTSPPSTTSPPRNPTVC